MTDYERQMLSERKFHDLVQYQIKIDAEIEAQVDFLSNYFDIDSPGYVRSFVVKSAGEGRYSVLLYAYIAS